MTRGILGAASLITVTFTLSGCATLFSGTTDQVSFNTEPSGARVLVDGIDRGTTPLTTSVKRSIGGASVTVRLDGYETRTFELGQEFNMTAIWNIFCLPGFWICGGIDVLSGAVMKYSPSTYNVQLDRREDLEEALDVEHVYLEHELYGDVIGIRNADMSGVIRPNIAIVNSTTRQITIFR